MRINYNLSAMLTNTQLLRNEKNQQSAAERLASGLKINHAKDDPAGMAISNKMDAQIEGIRQASRNSSDGISVLETADSSLNEVTNIIQRMRELAVQAASDTNGLEDREAIQVEIDSLTEEIDRVSKNTEFNKKVLLDGSLARRSYTNNRKVTVTNLGQGVPTDKYGVTITADARQAVFKGACGIGSDITIDGIDMNKDDRDKEIADAFVDGKLRKEAAGQFIINGQIIEFEGGETYDQIYEKLRTGCEIVDVTCIVSVNHDSTVLNGHWEGSADAPLSDGTYEDTAGYMPNPEGWGGLDALVFISKEYGSAEKINISCDNALLATALSLATRCGVAGELGHSARAFGTKTTGAELQCYKSTDIFLADMPNPPEELDRTNKAHEKYFQDPAVQGMERPALYNGGFIDLAEKDADGNLVNQKYMTFYDKVDAIPADVAGKITISTDVSKNGGLGVLGVTIEIKEGDTASRVFKKIQEACATKGIDVYLTDDERTSSYTITDTAYNYSQALIFRSNTAGGSIGVGTDNPKLATLLGLPVCEWTVEGKDCKATFTDEDGDPNNGTQRIGFSDSATISTKGNKIIVTDKNGFEIEMEAEKKTCGTYYADWSCQGRIGWDPTMEHGDEAGVISDLDTRGGYSNFPYGKGADIVADVTDFGMMTVHVGANEGQVIEMDIPEISTKTLGIDSLNVRSGYTADKALAKLDEALTKVNSARSRLGAYQNRLESTVASLDANDEDLTASVSRIRDVDMAQETTEYTQHTILVQAATSVLAQANDLPQQALQLIQ